MKIVAIVQARIGSTRLPGKVLKKIIGKPMIELLLTRLSKSKELDQIVVATSNNYKDNKLYSFVKTLGYKCFRGDENDVLKRFYNTSKITNADIIVRITGDCPMIDPEIVDKCIIGFKKSKVDYFSNTFPRTFPDGLDVAVMSFDAIKKAHNEARFKYDREHVTSYIINSKKFKKSSIQNKRDLSKLRWTVDYKADLNVISKIFKHFAPNINFSWKKILKLQKLKPNLFLDNKKIRNKKIVNLGTGQKLYLRAKK